MEIRNIQTGVITTTDEVFPNIGFGDGMPTDAWLLDRGYTKYVAPYVPIDYTEQNKSDLWAAAHRYEEARISGVALALLSLGVVQSKPKCLAVAAWSKNLWDGTYYPRKALITSEKIAPSQLDFSSCGEMPYSIPDLSAEIYGE